jgi:hypothetical protein
MTDKSRAERLGLEPGSVLQGAISGHEPRDAEITHSIAISLKRIADALDGASRQRGPAQVRSV